MSKSAIRPTTAKSPIGVGVIGAGNVLWAYLQLLDRLIPRGLAYLGPICARNRERWPDIRSRRPGIQLVAEPLAVVESDVDVILVITPPDSHSSLARLALEYGKHVVVEKPFALSPVEADGIVRLAESSRLHLLAAPFVQLSPTFQLLWQLIRDGAIGHIHSARGLYGNAGSQWATWYHKSGIGPLAEAGIYNLKSLTTLLGPVTEVTAADATAVKARCVGHAEIPEPDPDVSHVILRHQGGALSSIVSSQAIQRYRRPGLEVYGTEGTANLLGDDWDPRGIEIWRNDNARWEEYEPIESTWLWTSGLREIVMALFQGRRPLHELTQDIHLLEVIAAAKRAASERITVSVASRFDLINLRPEALPTQLNRHRLHDHTRPADEQ